jgi:hypothetical protein
MAPLPVHIVKAAINICQYASVDMEQYLDIFDYNPFSRPLINDDHWHILVEHRMNFKP